MCRKVNSQRFRALSVCIVEYVGKTQQQTRQKKSFLFSNRIWFLCAMFLTAFMQNEKNFCLYIRQNTQESSLSRSWSITM